MAHVFQLRQDTDENWLAEKSYFISRRSDFNI